MKKTTKQLNPPLHSQDVPATAGMMSKMEDRLSHKILAVDEKTSQLDKRFDEVDKKFDQVDKRFDEVDKRFDQVDKRFDQVDKRFDQVDKRFDQLVHMMNEGFHKLSAQIQNVALIVEEQNVRNKYVLDSYAQIYDWITPKK